MIARMDFMTGPFLLAEQLDFCFWFFIGYCVFWFRAAE